MKPKALIAEFLGTFALIFVGCGCIVSSSLAGAPTLIVAAFAHGLTIICVGTALGAISGGHFNPAVSFGLFLGKQITAATMGAYWIAQCLGALAGAFLVKGVFPASAGASTNYGALSLNAEVGAMPGMMLEALGAFILVAVVYGTAVDSRAPKLGALAIGLSITAMIFAFGPLTGCGINPARWLGPAVATGEMENMVTYIAGPLVGGGLAGLILPWLLKPEPSAAAA